MLEDEALQLSPRDKVRYNVVDAIDELRKNLSEETQEIGDRRVRMHHPEYVDAQVDLARKALQRLRDKGFIDGLEFTVFDVKRQDWASLGGTVGPDDFDVLIGVYVQGRKEYLGCGYFDKAD